MSSSWMQTPPLRMQAKHPVQYSICLSIAWRVCVCCGTASFIPSRNARVSCMVSLLSRLGLPFNTRIFIFVPPYWAAAVSPPRRNNLLYLCNIFILLLLSCLLIGFSVGNKFPLLNKLKLDL